MSEENKNLNNTKAPKAKKKKGGLKAFLKSKKARHGSIAVTILAVVIAIVVVINVVFGLLVDRFPQLKIDFTSNNSFALQEDTIDYMEHLDDDVTINVLMSQSNFEGSGSYFVQAKNLLEKMEGSSNGKVKVKYVDLTTNPTFTSKYSDIDWTVTTNNYLILIECGKQYKVLTLDDCFEYDADVYSYYGTYQFTGTTIEQAVVTAILNVTTEDKVVVDILTGNQEQDYTGIKNLLVNNAYEVNEISLVTQDIDEDAEIVIIFAPAVDLDESAAEKVSTWLNNDGKYGRTLVYIPSGNNVDTPNIDVLLDEWGMAVNDGYVFETSSDYLVSGSTPYAFVTDYTEYYADNLKNAKIPVVVSYASEIIIDDSTLAHALLTTSDKAGVQPYDPEEDWDYQEAVTGEPINVAAEGVLTNNDNESSRVIVFGSYEMFDQSIMSYNSFNNSTYFMNVINTVSDKEDMGITIESKSLESAELGVTDVATGNVLFAVFVIIIPVGILVMGIVMWLRRRNK